MSFALAPLAVLDQTRQNFRKLGLDLPAAVTDELAKIDQTLTRAEDLGSDTSGLAAAVFDALFAGKKPTDTKVMQEALLVQLKAINIRGRLDEEANRRRKDVLDRHAPALIDQMAPVIEDADAAFVAARDLIPNLSFEPSVASGLPANHMEAWGRARDAIERVDAVVAVYRLLAPVDRRFLALTVADLTLDDARRIGHKAVAVSLATGGHRLSLATLAEYRERLSDALATEDQNAEQARRAAEHYARTGRAIDAPVPVLTNALSRVPGGA